MQRSQVRAAVSGLVRRGARVTVGLARPSSRPRYAAAVRRHLTTPPRPHTGERCRACGAARPKVRTITSSKNAHRVCEVRICRRCGHVANPQNLRDYGEFEHIDKLPMRARVGTEKQGGREFQMARMAAEIMGRPDLDVLVYGAGRSLDNRHIEKLAGVRNVAIGDVMSLREDAEFIDITAPATRTFSLVIACEVIEHFLDPRTEFPALLKFLDKDGLLVCSTNIYDGGDLEKQNYIFVPGHTSYYTPKALAHLARANGFHLDFRVPEVALGYGGPRKRYVFLTRDRSLLTDIACYFGTHLYAASDPPRKSKILSRPAGQEKAEGQA